jgi:hypothetical protein
MSINFVVEDGTGLPTATSYITTDYANSYITNYASDANVGLWAGQTLSAQQKALNLATESIDYLYGQEYYGIPQSQSAPKPQQLQALLFPRYVFVINRIQLIQDGGLPVQLQKAVAEVAVMYINGIEIMPQPNTLGFVKSLQEKIGSLETNTTYRAEVKAEKYPGFWKVEQILKPILKVSDMPSYFSF